MKRIINGFEVDLAGERVFAEQQTVPNYGYLFEVSADWKRIVRCAHISAIGGDSDNPDGDAQLLEKDARQAVEEFLGCKRESGTFSAGGDGGRKPVRGRIANAKSIGWAIYAAGFVIWLFGYVSTGHAAVFDWDAATPWWISSFVPNLEAELGLALMFASMIPIYWRAGQRHTRNARSSCESAK